MKRSIILYGFIQFYVVITIVTHLGFHSLNYIKLYKIIEYRLFYIFVYNFTLYQLL